MNTIVYTDPSLQVILADFSRWLPDFSTGQHGFIACSMFVPAPYAAAFEAIDWPEMPHVVVSDQATGELWEGRMEQPAIVQGGISWTAYGYWQATNDIAFTFFGSETSLRRWQKTTPDIYAGSTGGHAGGPQKPELYQFEKATELTISLRKNETYATEEVGSFFFQLPHKSMIYYIEAVQFDYEFYAPSGWTFRVTSSLDFSSFITSKQVLSDGTTLTGSEDLSGFTRDVVEFRIYRTSSSFTHTGDTGQYYLKISNIRIKCIDVYKLGATNLLAHEIIDEVLTFINGINSSQLQASTVFVDATDEDLHDEVFEDTTAGLIFSNLALRHNFEVGVWENRTLFFRQKASAGREWYIDAVSIELEPNPNGRFNSVYAVYKTIDGRTKRTDTADDDVDIQNSGITRRTFVNSQTTDVTEAQSLRDIHLGDQANYALRAKIVFDKLTDITGAIYEITIVRAWDTITIRNIPPTLGTTVDEIRTFLTGATFFRRNGNMDIEPLTPTPTLVTLIAQKNAKAKL